MKRENKRRIGRTESGGWSEGMSCEEIGFLAKKTNAKSGNKKETRNTDNAMESEWSEKGEEQHKTDGVGDW